MKTNRKFTGSSNQIEGPFGICAECGQPYKIHNGRLRRHRKIDNKDAYCPGSSLHPAEIVTEKIDLYGRLPRRLLPFAHLIGVISDGELSKLSGVRPQNIYQYRQAHGINASRLEITLTPEERAKIIGDADREGFSDLVQYARHRMGLEAERE